MGLQQSYKNKNSHVLRLLLRRPTITTGICNKVGKEMKVNLNGSLGHLVVNSGGRHVLSLFRNSVKASAVTYVVYVSMYVQKEIEVVLF
jgi:hypothetical protein